MSRMSFGNCKPGKSRAFPQGMRTILSICLLSAFAHAADLSVDTLKNAPGFTWTAREAGRLDLYVESGAYAEKNLDALVRSLESSRARVEELLGVQSAARNTVFVVDSRARMKALTGFDTTAFANGRTVFAVYGETVKAKGAREMCLGLARTAWGAYSASWIREGLCVYADDEWQGLPLHGVAKSLLARGRLIPLKKLIKDSEFRKTPESIAAPETGSFVKFLYEKHGREALKVIWERGPKNIEELEIAWQATLAADAGKIDYKP